MKVCAAAVDSFRGVIFTETRNVDFPSKAASWTSPGVLILRGIRRVNSYLGWKLRLEFKFTSARIKALIEYLSPFGFRGRLLSTERSTRVAELSRGTIHVNGREVVVEIESTVSFEVSFIGPLAGLIVEVFLSKYLILPAKELGNCISREIECEAELDCNLKGMTYYTVRPEGL